MSICLKKRLALMCLFCLIATSICGVGFAVENEEDEGVQAVAYELIPLYVDGIRVGDGYMVDGTTYVPVDAFSDAMSREIQVQWDEETEIMTVLLEREVELKAETEQDVDAAEAEGAEVETEAKEAPELQLLSSACKERVTVVEQLHMTVKAGDAYITVNDRCFYAPGGVLYIDDVLMAPIRTLARGLGMEVSWHEETRSVGIDSRELTVIESGEAFYSEEDLYWLSHIIYAESGNQSLEGMIGVGNVVLNRVAEPTCPDTIHDVIFDRRYGVQFYPTVNGTIYEEPNELSIVAAKLCLEGYEVVGDSLFFVNPQVGISSWFVNTRTYVATIGEHVFFA